MFWFQVWPVSVVELVNYFCSVCFEIRTAVSGFKLSTCLEMSIFEILILRNLDFDELCMSIDISFSLFVQTLRKTMKNTSQHLIHKQRWISKDAANHKSRNQIYVQHPLKRCYDEKTGEKRTSCRRWRRKVGTHLCSSRTNVRSRWKWISQLMYSNKCKTGEFERERETHTQLDIPKDK